MWDKASEYFLKEVHLVKSAPLFFLLTFLLGVISAYFLAQWHYGGTLESLRERASLYEAKLQVTSPDEAIEKVKMLQANLDLATKKLETFSSQQIGLSKASTHCNRNEQIAIPHPQIPCDVSGKSVSTNCVSILLERYISALNQCNSILNPSLN